jgi:betaine-aldehyde dehydrogenase
MSYTTPFPADPAEHLIDGKRVAAGTIRESVNPATGEILGTYHDADLDVASAAITAARTAYANSDWRHDRELRANVLWGLATAVEENLDTLALAITLENGKPLGQAKFELSIAAPKLRYFAGLALTDLGTAASVYQGGNSMLLREGLGAAGVIVPWNSPGILSIRSIAPALAAGCTAAVKMPAQTALTNSLLAGVFSSVAALPPGVLNMFTESGDTGAKELVSSDDIAVVSYTGSTAVGAHIASAAGAHLKKVSLELGGKTPMIVFDDADLDAAVPTLVAGITVFAGQFCMTGSRILVQEGVADALRGRLIDALEQIEPRAGTDPDCEMGPLIDRAAVTRVDRFLLDNDAQFIVRGGPMDGPGAFYKPALVAVQDLDSPLIQQEIFGPVATFETFNDEADAVRRANATDFGLAASIWTRDGARALRVSQQVEAGTVWTNAWAQILDQFEEGGYKKSGLGRLNGPGGLAEFQEVKHIYRATI